MVKSTPIASMPMVTHSSIKQQNNNVPSKIEKYTLSLHPLHATSTPKSGAICLSKNAPSKAKILPQKSFELIQYTVHVLYLKIKHTTSKPYNKIERDVQQEPYGCVDDAINKHPKHLVASHLNKHHVHTFIVQNR